MRRSKALWKAAATDRLRDRARILARVAAFNVLLRVRAPWAVAFARGQLRDRFLIWLVWPAPAGPQRPGPATHFVNVIRAAAGRSARVDRGIVDREEREERLKRQFVAGELTVRSLEIELAHLPR